MDKKTTVRRKSSKKKKKARLRFSFGFFLFIIFFSFAVCFALYMVSANLHANFLNDEFGDIISEEQERPDTPAQSDNAEDTDTPAEALDTEAGETAAPSGPNPVPGSAAVDVSYFDNCCLICDGTLPNVADHGKFAKSNIFSSAELGAAACNTMKIDSSFGNVTVYDIIKDKKPEVLYIMLGNDIGTSSADEMANGYTELVTNLRGALPDMKIYVMQLPPVIYDNDNVTNEMINGFNNKLIEMCNKAGIFCIDTNTALKSEDGKLAEKYWSYETLSLSAEAYDALSDYILTHTA